MKKQTKPTSIQDIKREWHLVDVNGKVLGRIAVEIAKKLMGKSKPNFTRNLDCGDHVVVINSKNITVTGKKADQKFYGRYSGFPGGLKQKTFKQVQSKNPTFPIRNAVYGMLPKNKLRDQLITRLYIYPEAEHPYVHKIKKENQ